MWIGRVETTMPRFVMEGCNTVRCYDIEHPSVLIYYYLQILTGILVLEFGTVTVSIRQFFVQQSSLTLQDCPTAEQAGCVGEGCCGIGTGG